MKRFFASLLCFLCAHQASASPDEVKFLNSGAVISSSFNLPFSEAVSVGGVVYLSGQIGIRPGTLSLVEGGIDAEAKQTMENINLILEANNLSMSDVFKCTVILADIAEWPRFNKIYQNFFKKPYPVRSAFASSGLALGARVEVECMAVVR